MVILQSGLDATMQQQLEQTVRSAHAHATPMMIDVDLAPVRHLTQHGKMPSIVYARLLLPSLLPDVSKILYLDSDMIVLRDVTELWETVLDDHPVAAVPDVFLSTNLASIPHAQKLGLDVDAPYVSSAVMLMDLDRWRRRKIAERTTEWIAANLDSVRWWDQDGINAVIQGDVASLDQRWCVWTQSSRLLGWKPNDEQERILKPIEDDAWIVHYATRYKPWKADCPHPRAALFLEELDCTAFAGWRPDPSSAIPFPPQD